MLLRYLKVINPPQINMKNLFIGKIGKNTDQIVRIFSHGQRAQRRKESVPVFSIDHKGI